MSANEFERFNYTVQECRKGLEADVKSFGSRFSLLQKALELLDVPEHQELVREWFDIYMMVIDEASYLELGGKMDKLETAILRAWYNSRKS